MDVTKNISDKAKSVIDYSDLGIECGYYFNPVGNFSVIPFGDYYLASFRAFGYYITSDIHQYVFTPSMRLKEPHKYIFCLLDRDFKFVKQLKCVQSTYWEHPVWNKRLPYLEDMRMTIWNGQVYGISTIIYQDENKYAAIGLQLQKIEVSGDFVSCQHVWNSLQVGMQGIQKNFMAIPDKPFNYIAATFPKGAVQFDIHSNKFTQGGTIEPEKLLRGNTPLIQTDFCYMTITHMLDFDERKRKRYNNFLVEYNADLSIRRISNPFKLTDQNIEFITTFIEDGDDLLIGDTVMDETPLLFRFNKHEFFKCVSKE